jgi:hypothetical protein
MNRSRTKGVSSAISTVLPGAVDDAMMSRVYNPSRLIGRKEPF